MSYKSGGNCHRGARGIIFRNKTAVMLQSVERKKMMRQHAPSKARGPGCRTKLIKGQKSQSDETESNRGRAWDTDRDVTKHPEDPFLRGGP